MELRYKHVEVALAEVIGIGPNDMPAFRARLRHLRNIGVPRLPNPGSGQPIAYTRQQALELLLALELEKVGQAPKKMETTLQKEELVRLAKTIVRQSPYGKYKGKDCFAVVTESRPRGYLGVWCEAVFGIHEIRAPRLFGHQRLRLCAAAQSCARSSPRDVEFFRPS